MNDRGVMCPTHLATLIFWLGLSGIFNPAIAQDALINLYHFSDYHSHALPFFSEGRPGQGGIARAIEYLRTEKKKDPEALMLNGGDTMNRGSPAYSDKFRCEDWSWFNGLTDAMALGNHEFDYGYKVFEECRKKIKYPILSASLVYSLNRKPVFNLKGKPYLILKRKGLRIGLFALAGADFPALISKKDLPEGTEFTDTIATAKMVVEALRKENVHAIIKIGHNSYDEDVALAKAVPGINLILGTHSHRKENLALIPGTQTWTVSPYQFLSYITHLEIRFHEGGILNVGGDIVRMDSHLPEAADVKKRVEWNEQKLRGDPQFVSRFKKIGTIETNISNNSIYSVETELGNWVMDILRVRMKAHVSVSTASSFRSGIPKGDLTVEVLHDALPFENRVMLLEMKGNELRSLFEISMKRRGSDSFLQFSGAKIVAKGGSLKQILILKDRSDPSLGYLPLVDTETYRVAMTDFLVDVSMDYRSLLSGVKDKDREDFTVNDAVIDGLSSSLPLKPKLDGRIRFED